MKTFYLINFFLISSFSYLTSQEDVLSYYPDIYRIIQKHCVDCHHENGPAPFSLESAENVKKRAGFIAHVTKIGYMPPWKADTAFGVHRNARVLSDEEIQLLSEWAESGAVIGESKDFIVDSSKGISNPLQDSFLYLELNNEYNIPSNRTDDFRFFYLPFGNKETMYLRGIEFVAQNKKRVHHSRIMVDTTGTIEGINGLSETDPEIYKFQTKPLADEFLYGWVPGNFTFKFPKGFGKKMFKNSHLVLNIHYSPSSLNETDRSGVKLFLEKSDKVQREVKTLILRENQISNPPFSIPANKESTFYMSSGLIKRDLSLLTVQPHAHLLGKSFRAFAITEQGDLIPLIKIDKWDFNWQTTYEFPKLVHIPANSVILMEGTYDNTSSNPLNPNDPPVDVGYGWRTVDEMMNLIFYFVEYLPGDEDLVLEYD